MGDHNIPFWSFSNFRHLYAPHSRSRRRKNIIMQQDNYTKGTDRKTATRAQQQRQTPQAAAQQTQTYHQPAKRKNTLGDLFIRIRSGAIYIAITVICALLGDIPFMLYLAAMSAICAHEFLVMTTKTPQGDPNVMIGTVAAASYVPVTYFFGISGALVFATGYLLALLALYALSKRTSMRETGLLYLGAAYTGLLSCGMLLIMQAAYGFWGSVLVIGVLASAWLADGAAYLAGCKIGRHKMAPSISPKKSWEGLTAGVIASVVVWIAISFIPTVILSPVVAAAFGVIVALAGFAGDLVESKIKRIADAKDSGTVMPGHGGLLDRCDSVLFAGPVAYVLLVASGAISNILLVIF